MNHRQTYNHMTNQEDMLLSAWIICVILYILRVKSLAIYFDDSQFRRNRTYNFIVSKYMLTNVHEYDDINRLTFHIT